MLIDGIAYLLGSSTNGTEWVSRYTAAEMAEIFGADDRRALEHGEAVILPGRYADVRYIDMVAVARAVVD